MKDVLGKSQFEMFVCVVRLVLDAVCRAVNIGHRILLLATAGAMTLNLMLLYGTRLRKPVCSTLERKESQRIWPMETRARPPVLFLHDEMDPRIMHKSAPPVETYIISFDIVYWLL